MNQPRPKAAPGLEPDHVTEAIDAGSPARARLIRLLPYLWTVLTLWSCIGKPLNIDDHVYVVMARNIAKDLFDPYAGTIHWYSTFQPLFEVNENPPLLSYWLALTSAWSDWNPVVMHLALLPITLAGVHGIGVLSEQFGGNRWVAQMGLATSSLWLVSASSLMVEVPMVTLAIWGLVAFRKAELEPHADLRWAVVSGFVLGLAFLTKFSAVVPAGAIGLALVARRKPGPVVGFVVGFVIVAGAFEVLTFIRYGAPKFLDALLYATGSNQPAASAELRLISTLMFLGAGGLSLVGLVGPAHATRRAVGAVLSVAVVLSALLLVVILPGSGSNLVVSSSTFAHAIAFIGAGASVVWLLVKSFPSEGRVLLVSGVVITVLFSSVLNWSTNARSMLPALPFLAVWLSTSAPQQRARNAAWLGISALLSLLVLWGDVVWASSLRASAIWADQFLPAERKHIFFVGHWGFQPVMEAFGFQPLDEARPAKVGDLVVVPGKSYAGPPLDHHEYLDGYDEPVFSPAATMDSDAGAGFYWVTANSPFPFTLGTTLHERIYIFRLIPNN